MPDYLRPRVEELQGRVLIWAGELGSDATGLVISADAAVDTGLELAALGAKLIGQPINLNSAVITVQVPEAPLEEEAAHLVLTAEGAPLTMRLTATQLVELTAALSALAQDL